MINEHKEHHTLHSEVAQLDRTYAHPLYGVALTAARAAAAVAADTWALDAKAAWSEFFEGEPNPPSKVYPSGKMVDTSQSLYIYCCAERAAARVYGPEATVDGKAAWTASNVERDG